MVTFSPSICLCRSFEFYFFHRKEISVVSLETFLRIGNNKENYLLLAAHQSEVYAFQNILQTLCPYHPPFWGLKKVNLLCTLCINSIMARALPSNEVKIEVDNKSSLTQAAILHCWTISAVSATHLIFGCIEVTQMQKPTIHVQMQKTIICGN